MVMMVVKVLGYGSDAMYNGGDLVMMINQYTRIHNLFGFILTSPQVAVSSYCSFQLAHRQVPVYWGCMCHWKIVYASK